MKSLLTGIATAAVIAFAAMGAQAATYNLTGFGGYETSYTIGDLTVTPGVRDGNNVQTQGWVHQNNDGMGVANSYGDNSSEVDGSGLDDVLIFSFSSAVQLISATFSNVYNDEFVFWFDDDANGNLNGDRVGSADPFGSTYTFAGTYIGELFGLGAESSHDFWRVKSIEANAISAVPLPAALPLYGAGLAVMGFVGWRKRRKAAAQA